MSKILFNHCHGLRLKPENTVDDVDLVVPRGKCGLSFLPFVLLLKKIPSEDRDLESLSERLQLYYSVTQ